MKVFLRRILLVLIINLFGVFTMPRINAASYQVFIKREGATTIACEVTPFTMISELKQMIFDNKGLEVDRQILTFADSELENNKIIADYNIPKDATLTLRYIDSFTVNFVTNNDANIDSQMILEGETIDQPIDPNYNSHIFEGWFSDSNFLNPYDFNMPVFSDLTLYAKWREETNEGGIIKAPDTSVISIIGAEPNFTLQFYLSSISSILYILRKKRY